MKCEVVQDLIPLYLDGCCSEESGRLVKEHAESCGVCRAMLKNADLAPKVSEIPVPAPKLRRISLWKASAVQSVLFFICFLIITWGVAKEAAIPSGLLNGFWAFYVVAPAAGFLLSLVNWYFVRLYRSRRSFAVWSAATTAAAMFVCAVWCLWHYEWTVSLNSLLGLLRLGMYACGIGLLPAVNLLLSAVLSNWYAKTIGKE